jgi:hypothetical protein
MFRNEMTATGGIGYVQGLPRKPNPVVASEEERRNNRRYTPGLLRSSQ